MSKFLELGLNSLIVEAVESMGFQTPTPIQEQTIPTILSTKQDVLALAQTGTGKTAAFSLPIINQIDCNDKTVQALILCPTRELCVQISKDIAQFSANINRLKTLAVYGGANISEQMKALKSGVQIVVGTPGRTLDLLERRALKINKISWLALDEADEMLNMGFQEDLDAILSTSPADKQVLLFSATMPKAIQGITKKYMNKPIEITVGKRNSGAENVVHQYYMVNARDRYAALKRIVDMSPNVYGIIFCRTRRETKEVANKLSVDGYNVDALYGDLSQAQRDHVMNHFRVKRLQLLVATDVAARGLDVNDLSHVINYNLPDDLEAYVHRSGRTGRAGKSGVSIAIIHSRETRKIQELEKITGKQFKHELVPDGKQICEKQLFNLIDKVENITVNEHQIEHFLPVIYKKLEWLNREQLIKHFVSVEFNRFLDYYNNAPDLNVSPNLKQKARGGKKSSKNNTEYTRFFINIGKKDNLTTTKFMRFINRGMKDVNFDIGAIDLMKTFSFFEIDKSVEKEVLQSLNNSNYDGRRVSVEISKPSSSSSSLKGSKKSSKKKEEKFFDKFSKNKRKKRR